MKYTHTDLFKDTITQILSAINEGMRKDDDSFIAGGERMRWFEIVFLQDLQEKLENEQYKVREN